MSVKANKSYKKGGKVIAQGADKSDVRAERKQGRLERKQERKTDKDLKKFGKALMAGAKAGAKAVKKAKKKGDRNFKSDVRSGKLKQVSPGEKSKTTRISVGDKTRTVVKQKNKSADGVRSTRKTVYGSDKGNIVTKEKQRTNRKGKKVGMISFKEKTVDRKDFTEKNKRK